MSSFANIKSALRSRLTLLPNLPDVAWENREYHPTVGTEYLRVWMLPAESYQVGAGDAGENEESGIFQVTLSYPSGNGDKDITAMADAIMNHFKRGTVLNYQGQQVKIRKAYPGPMKQEPDWLHLPLSIVYFAHTPN